MSSGPSARPPDRVVDRVRCLPLAEFLAASQLLLIDLEFTCWEDSLRTAWADPGWPPEVLEIGVAALDCRRGVVLDTNPELSPYCRELLGIAQADADAAPALVDVAPALTAWAAGGSWADAPTCGWSLIDREFLRAGARRDGLADPLGGCPHVDLERLFAARLGASSRVDRDDGRARLGLPANAARHTALGDALDLITFCAALRAGAPA